MHASRASSIDSGAGHSAPVVWRQDIVPELRELIAVQGVPALSEPEDVVHVQHAALPTPDLKKQRRHCNCIYASFLASVTVFRRRF